jgi:hypothetical protein
MAPLRTLSGLAARFCTPYEVFDAVVREHDPEKVADFSDKIMRRNK